MNSKSPCISVIYLTPKLSEQRYALRLVVFTCWYFPSTSLSFQPIFPSPLSHISSVAVLNLLRCCINPCCLASLPPFSSAAVFTAELVYYPHYTGVTILPQVGSRSLLIFDHSVAVIPNHFAISITLHLTCCRPTSPPPPYPFILSRISATMLVRICLQYWPCLPSLLSSFSTAPPFSSSHIDSSTRWGSTRGGSTRA